MLELKTVSRHFGGVRAVDDLDLHVAAGQIFGLIGPNGSGKSTTVNLVTGLFPLTLFFLPMSPAMCCRRRPGIHSYGNTGLM